MTREQVVETKSAEIIQIRDYQNKKDLERIRDAYQAGLYYGPFRSGPIKDAHEYVAPPQDSA